MSKLLSRRAVLPGLLAPWALNAMLAAAPARAEVAPRPLARRASLVVGTAGKTEIYAAILLAAAMGEFDRENIDVEFRLQRPSDGLLLLATDRIDVLCSQPGAAFFNAVAGGNDVRMVCGAGVAAPGNKQGFWVSRAWLAGRPFTPDLLKGQVIGSAVGPGTTVSWWLEAQLETVGLDIRAVSFRTIGINDILVALENGAVNVGFLFDGIWQHADLSRIAFAFGGTTDIAGGYFFGPSLLHARREVGEGFVRALSRSCATYLQGNYHGDARVAPVLAKAMGITLDELHLAGGLRFPPDMPIVDYTAAVLQKLYALSPGVLSYPAPLADKDVFDRGFLAAAGFAQP